MCPMCVTNYLCPSVHAAVIAINEAVDRRVPADTFTALRNPNAMLVNLDEVLASTYQDVLYQAKQNKMANAKNRVKNEMSILRDLYSFAFSCNPILKHEFY